LLAAYHAIIQRNPEFTRQVRCRGNAGLAAEDTHRTQLVPTLGETTQRRLASRSAEWL